MSEVAALIQEALSFIIALSGILLAVGIALSFVAQQAHVMSGRSEGVQLAWARILGMIVGLLIVLLASPVSQMFVNALVGL